MSLDELLACLEAVLVCFVCLFLGTVYPMIFPRKTSPPWCGRMVLQPSLSCSPRCRHLTRCVSFCRSTKATGSAGPHDSLPTKSTFLTDWTSSGTPKKAGIAVGWAGIGPCPSMPIRFRRRWDSHHRNQPPLLIHPSQVRPGVLSSQGTERAHRDLSARTTH